MSQTIISKKLTKNSVYLRQYAESAELLSRLYFMILVIVQKYLVYCSAVTLKLMVNQQEKYLLEIFIRNIFYENHVLLVLVLLLLNLG